MSKKLGEKLVMSKRVVKNLLVLGVMCSSFACAMAPEQESLKPNVHEINVHEIVVPDASAQHTISVIVPATMPARWVNVRENLPAIWRESLEKRHTQEQLNAALETLGATQSVPQENFAFMQAFVPTLTLADHVRIQQARAQNGCWEDIACKSLIWTSKWAFRGLCSALIILFAAFKIQCEN